jgi:diguanylate cyclase (GGDEF)-like protein
MTGPEPAGVPPQFVQTWASAIHRACFVPMSRAERCELLSRLTGWLIDGLRAEPFDPRPGHRAGAALVAADYTAPEVLARTITVLHTRLLPELSQPGEAAAARLSALVEGVAAGFARALRDRTLDDQEEIRLATTTARAEAERALRDSEARLRYAALHDPLTGLPNQALLTQQLRHLLADPPPGARLGLCRVDLDRFEAINNSLGWPVGDRLLAAVADRLRALAAEPGYLVARHTADQFALLVPRTSCAEDATKVADRVLAALAEPFRVDGHELSVMASAGVVERPAAGASPTELIRAADVALHWAKTDGARGWALFEQPRSARDGARYRLSAQLPGALRRGEFSLAYQPLVDLRSAAVVGYEALARWQHPEHGVLGADRFVSLAEDTGVIVPLGLRLLEQACDQAARWYADPAEHRRPYVSVNVSARQLQRPGLVGEVVEVLDRTGLPPRQLQLEITESAVVVSGGEMVARLAALANQGIRIVIDDFGTGYSNFAYLYDLPVHGIKLAGQLLRDVGKNGAPASRTGNAVLAAMVSLGCTLGLTVTAEGVETAGQAQLLRVLGCHVGQGWHFGHPAPGAPDR